MPNFILGRVVSVAVSAGGIPRLPVATLTLTEQGISGDGHRYAEHYAASRGVSLFDQESIQRMSHAAWPLHPGCVGENITLADVNLSQLQVGNILILGSVRLELTRRWIPCHASSHETGETRINMEKLPGYFAQVVNPGTVEPGCQVIVEAT